MDRIGFRADGTVYVVGPTTTAQPAPSAMLVIAFQRSVTASTAPYSWAPPSAATDGDANTRWASASASPQSLTVDLGSVKNSQVIDIFWEDAHAVDYDIQVSHDGINFDTEMEIRGGEGGKVRHVLERMVAAKYVRIKCLTPNHFGLYSIWDVKILGIDEVALDESLLKPVDITITKGGAGVPTTMQYTVDLFIPNLVSTLEITGDFDAFSVLVSNDGVHFSEIYESNEYSRRIHSLPSLTPARYLKVFFHNVSGTPDVKIYTKGAIQDRSSHKLTTASSEWSSWASAGNVVDGNPYTRWASEYGGSDDQWIGVDLGD